MTFICGVAKANRGVEHRHELVSEITDWCRGIKAAPPVGGPLTARAGVPVPQPATVPARSVAGTTRPLTHAELDPYGRTKEQMPTRAQLDYVEHLGGDVTHAMTLTKAACSSYLDALEARAVTRAPAAKMDIPFQMLDLIKEGNYATRASATEPYVFFRVTRPSAGKYKGAFKVQTRHSDQLRLAYVHWPSGRDTVIRPNIKESLLVLIADQDAAARAFARELGCCCNCGRSLTDERSRWYGIGPECETFRPDVIEWVHLNEGVYQPGR